jgi:hypothetical protein
MVSPGLSFFGRLWGLQISKTLLDVISWIQDVIPYQHVIPSFLAITFSDSLPNFVFCSAN